MWPFLVFGSSAILALLLLYFFRAKAWYWHVLSVLLAGAIAVIPRGVIPVPPQPNENTVYLAVGFLVVFLFLWGVGALVFRPRRQA